MILKVIKLCFSGFYGLLQDSASTFALLTLIGVLVVTAWKPSIGGVSLAAYCTVVPAILAFCQHKITLAQLGSTLSPPNVTQTVTTTTSSDLPPNGQL